jgi:hypothetical protein
MAGESALAHFGQADRPLTDLRMEQAKEVLAVVGAHPEEYGLDEGDLLTSLATKRRTLDAFSVFCNVYGGLMSVLGPLVTTVISIFSLLLFLKFAVEGAIKMATWLKETVMGPFAPMVAATKLATSNPLLVGPTFGAMLYNYLFSAEKSDAQQDAVGDFVRMSGNAIQGMVLGFMHPAIATVVNVAAGELWNAIFDQAVDQRVSDALKAKG